MRRRGVRWALGILLASALLLLPDGQTAWAADPNKQGTGPNQAAGVLALRRATIWSLRVSSSQLLADRGYAIEYLFEFLDEEELRVRSLGAGEIESGRVRTILDGELAEIEIRLRDDALPLVIQRDGARIVAAWKQGDRLIPCDLSPAEVARRSGLMLNLLTETRSRLGLARFHPSETPWIRLRVSAVDAIAFVPADDREETYEIGRLRTPDVTEHISVEVDGFHWDVTWHKGELLARVYSVSTTVVTTVVYQNGTLMGIAGDRRRLDTAEAARIAGIARGLLDAARRQFGTATVTQPLPAISGRR